VEVVNIPADCTFVYKNLAVGGGIFIEENFKELRNHYGITHILNAQSEFDDTPIARYYGIESCWVPSWDDFSKPDEKQFVKAGKFIDNSILKDPNAKLLCHCAGGVHRGPMFALLAAMWCGVSAKDAIENIESRRLIARFPDTYKKAVTGFMHKQKKV
jgi:protein tyrosine phosphatase